MPQFDDVFYRLQENPQFSAIHLMQDCYQMGSKPGDCDKMAFRTLSRLCDFKVLPFGLVNVPTVFKTIINRLFSQQTWSFVLFFLDILVSGKTLEE